MFFGLKVLDQAHFLTSFLLPAKQWYEQNKIPCAAFELDLDRMFPNIRRERVPLAYEDLCKRYLDLVGPRWDTSAVFVSIAKGGSRDMDCVGQRDSRYLFVPPPPCRSPPLVVPRGGLGDRHLVNPKFFVAAHCVVVWVPVLWGTTTCIPCTHGRTGRQNHHPRVLPKAFQWKVVSMCKSSR